MAAVDQPNPRGCAGNGQRELQTLVLEHTHDFGPSTSGRGCRLWLKPRPAYGGPARQICPPPAQMSPRWKGGPVMDVVEDPTPPTYGDNRAWSPGAHIKGPTLLLGRIRPPGMDTVLQEELEKMTKELQHQTESLYNITSQLHMTEAKLTEFEGHYKTSIGSLQRKYVASIDALESQNIDLKQLFALKAEELCVLKAKMDDLERQKHFKMKEKLLSRIEDQSKVSASNTEGTLRPDPPPAPQTDGSKPQG